MQSCHHRVALAEPRGCHRRLDAGAPDDNIFAAGISQSQGFLPAVAEGRITTERWIDRIAGRTVHFSDGQRGEYDATLFGTGFRPALPWLDPSIAAMICLDGPASDLYAQSFHPDLAGLAFVGLYAPQRTSDAASAFGRIVSPDYEAEEACLRELIVAARRAAA